MRYLVIILLFSVQSAFGQAVKLYLNETQIRTNFTFIDPASTEEAGKFLIDSDGTGNVTWGRGIDTVKISNDTLTVIFGDGSDSISVDLIEFNTSLGDNGYNLEWDNNYLGFGITIAGLRMDIGTFKYLTGINALGQSVNSATSTTSNVSSTVIVDSTKVQIGYGNLGGDANTIISDNDNILITTTTTGDSIVLSSGGKLLTTSESVTNIFSGDSIFIDTDSSLWLNSIDSIYVLKTPPPNYTNDAAADADSGLPSGALYTIDADTRAIRRKP